mgnify:CR=1 FL=1
MLDKVVKSFQFSYEAIQSVRFAETTSTFFDLTNFAFGFVGLHNLVNGYCFDDRDISKSYENLPHWQQKAFKIADFLGAFSLIFRAVNSGPAIVIWNWSAKVLLSPMQLERFFGHHGYLPADKMDRTIASAAFLLGLPSTLKTICSIYMWATSPRFESEPEESSHHYKVVLVQDVYLTIRTVSLTAHQILQTPSK